MNDKYRILLVEDEEAQLKGLQEIIKRNPVLAKFIEKIEYRCLVEGAGEVAKEIASQPSKWNIIISDLYMPTPEKGGLLIVSELIPCFQKDSDFPVKLILITNKEEAPGGLREFLPKYRDWLTWKPKPIITSCDILKDNLYSNEALWAYEIAKAIEKLNNITIQDDLSIDDFSGKMIITRSKADFAAKTNDTVLLLGDSGTGKGVFAEYIHKKSKFREEPFVTVDCTNASNLLEVRLFGRMPNISFEGANREVGAFENAVKGIVFLDEIGDLPIELQPKLLSVLEPNTRRFTILGGKTIEFEGKVICATSRNLEEMVSKKEFYKDLHTRIANCYTITIPPLRETKADIVPLAERLIAKECKKKNLEMKELSKDAKRVLEDYDWPGNARELVGNIAGAIEFSNLAERKEIIPQDFSSILRAKTMEEQLERLVNCPPDEFVLKIAKLSQDVLKTWRNDKTIKDKIIEGIKGLLSREETITKVANLMGFNKSRYFYKWLDDWGLTIKDIT